ncbi:hypothetical protein KIN20_003880 [Parelaphostrongylus tenuis]|uniref:AB hydrolase-1 domain-containing protein n=1 Tax=Parelaphostrongylus tenuis TaxID=148309 RepID=A0AAD5QGG3_PARTN|nr:hypothetical protein KIN20_003880 [Parelaphostrongylus tenuis]
MGGRVYGLLTGPRLYRVFGQSERTTNIVENIGDNAMSFARGLFFFSTSLAFSPVVLAFLYNRGGFNIHTLLAVIKYTSYLAVLAFGGRLVGRTMDREYRQFINIWLKARNSGKYEDNQALKRYDFDLEGVNADFTALPNENLWYHKRVHIDGNPLTMCAAWYAIHAFGRHMLYPGSVALLNWLLSSSLLSARNSMVTTKQGQRAWLRSTEGDLIDTMFIRGEEDNPEKRNQTLVISCEGNAGYYEIGIANTPSQMGYSVLGWNQPGFGQSSGLPFPKNTLAAADAVMQYAQNALGFREEEIVLFGWSIGGFPASWLAANYPNVKAVILDATFDDVLPLAQARMPKILADVVEYAIRTHFDLNIQAIISHYKGPIKTYSTTAGRNVDYCRNGNGSGASCIEQSKFLAERHSTAATSCSDGRS